MSNSVRPHRQHPTRLLRPWDSPGKNTGMGCHFLLQCKKVKGESEIAQPYPTLRDPRDCRLPGSSVHGIFQARVLEWGAIAFSGYKASLNLFPLLPILAAHQNLIGSLYLLLSPFYRSSSYLVPASCCQAGLPCRPKKYRCRTRAASLNTHAGSGFQNGTSVH